MRAKTITDKELDVLILRLQEAIENDLSLSKEDMKLIMEIILSFAHLSEELNDSDTTLKKLKKLAGLVSSSEKFKDVTNRTEKAKPKPEKIEKPKEKEKPIEQIICNHKVEGLSKGDICPECSKGKLYKYEPSEFVRVSGQSPLVNTKHIFERLRCNSCGVYFKASTPPEVKEDGGEKQKYGYSARSIMAIYKYFGGLPFHRQESLNHILGVPVSASTTFEQCEYVANDILPVLNHLKKIAANASNYCLDDTTNRILNAGKEMIPDRRNGKLKERSGVYTSGLIAELTDSTKIVLFKTNIGHAGEFIDEILKGRDAHAPPPIIMSDALKSNMPSVIKKYHRTLCNAHARREFVDVYDHFLKKVEWVMEEYGKIWKNDYPKLPPKERLEYHKTHSLPVLEGIKTWALEQLETNQTEENSGLGKAIKYFLNNFDHLSAFCNIEGARIDNNEMEATLKLIIRSRKNSLFLKTQAGADIADVLTSIIATCEKYGVSSFYYLTDIQKPSFRIPHKEFE